MLTAPNLRTLAALSVASLLGALGASVASCSSGGSDGATPGPDGSASQDGSSGGPGADAQTNPTPALDCTRPLAIDTAFAANGVWRTPRNFTDGPEGGIRVRGLPGGGVLLAAGNAMAKIRADGVVDETFQPDQVLFDPDHERRLVEIGIDTHGAVFVAWQRTASTSNVVEIARLTASGALDASFGDGGIASLPSYGDGGTVSQYGLRLAFGGDGAVYVMGVIGSQGGSSASETFLTKLDPIGHVVKTYGDGTGSLVVPGAGGAAGLAPRDDGHAIFGFLFRLGASQTVLFSLDPSGRPDKSFGDDGGLAPDFMKNTGEILGLASGDALARGDRELRKLHPTGQWDVAFGTDGGAVSLETDGGTNGALYYSAASARSDGSFALLARRAVAGSPIEETPMIARFDPNGQPCGTIDAPFATAESSAVLSIAPSGEIFVAGWENAEAGNYDTVLVTGIR